MKKNAIILNGQEIKISEKLAQQIVDSVEIVLPKSWEKLEVIEGYASDGDGGITEYLGSRLHT